MDELIGKLFMIGLPSHEVDDPTKRVLESVKPGSIILFKRNIKSRKQITTFIESIAKFLGYKPLMAIDQEGGIVTRLTEGFSMAPSAMGLAMSNNPDNAYTAGRIIGSEMKDVGIDWNLAPVVDINNNSDNPAIGIRSFSNNKDTVIEYASKFVLGLKESGVISCLKHFPGNGRVASDPHIDMPVLNVPKAELYKTELSPFLSINAPSWMPTHIYIPAIQSSKEPITVSKEILTDMIRGELGYKGVLLADDLNMGGVSNFYLPEELAFKTLSAGMDMLSFCDNTTKQIAAKKYLRKKIIQDKFFLEKIVKSSERIENLFLERETSNTDKNLSDFSRNRIVMDVISKESVLILKNNDNLLPLTGIDNIFAVKATRLVRVEEDIESLPLVVKKAGELLNCPVTIYRRDLTAEEADVLLSISNGKRNMIFTENAHLVQRQKIFIEKLADISLSLVLIALRDPYDADIMGVKSAICSYGYNVSQQEEILNKLINVKYIFN